MLVAMLVVAVDAKPGAAIDDRPVWTQDGPASTST
jgi:hypothetical protein